MRTPEPPVHRRGAINKKLLESEPQMNYLSPGAFTVLPLDSEKLPNPPPAPPPYRLPTTTKRMTHPAFAIIGEIPQPSSAANSPRSSSPASGRVSPFRGHGFNPTGSRHASPTPPISRKNSLPSKIPKLNGNNSSSSNKSRKSSSGEVFGEKVVSHHHHHHVGFLNRNSSQSLTNLDEPTSKLIKKKPRPPLTNNNNNNSTPGKRKLKNIAAFKQLSPIQGSSPEPSQYTASPSRIPKTKSRSTPPSRFTSPTRNGGTTLPPPNRSRSRSNIRSKINDTTSPVTSPTRIKPIMRNNKYEHVQPKINTFNKPKLPPKPISKVQTMMDSAEDSESVSTTTTTSPKKKVLSRKNSINQISGSRPNLLPKTFLGSKLNLAQQSDSSDTTTTTDYSNNRKISSNVSKPAPNNNNNNNNNSNKKKIPENNKFHRKPSIGELKVKENAELLLLKKKESKNDLTTSSDETTTTTPSALNVVNSTTNTVTKPLNIETPKLGRTNNNNKPVSPMIDGRVLSATSVSQAINKMNDTVLNTQTLIKDSGLNNRVPTAAAAASIVSTVNKNEEEPKKKIDEKLPITNKEPQPLAESTITKSAAVNTTPLLPSLKSSLQLPPATPADLQNEEKTAKVAPNNVTPTTTTTTNHNNANNNNNHLTTIGIGTAKAIEKEVQNNMNHHHRLLIGSTDSSLDGGNNNNHNKMSINDRIKEARTVIASDVKPIKITVREKPSEIDVQSGNVGPNFGIANGINERPSLPPSAQQQQSSLPNEEIKEDAASSNPCRKFFSSCTKVLSCGTCLTLTCCKCCCKKSGNNEEINNTNGCFQSFTQKFKRNSPSSSVAKDTKINIENNDDEEQIKIEEDETKSFWQKLICSSCCKKNKIGDSHQSCFPTRGKRKESWTEQSSATVEQEFNKPKCCSKKAWIVFFNLIFCCYCCRKREELPSVPRKESMVSGKKKSLTPMSVPPLEDATPKIDASLVEHNSHMKAAIPILPVWLAWFCCVMNCIGPGTGTVLSGMFCLCIGKPRFSQKDGPKPRIGAFIIDFIIGFSQFFTVLFCLVGWGWSIWWGIIMIKIAKKHRKLKNLEKIEEMSGKPSTQPIMPAGNHRRDLERGMK